MRIWMVKRATMLGAVGVVGGEWGVGLRVRRGGWMLDGLMDAGWADGEGSDRMDSWMERKKNKKNKKKRCGESGGFWGHGVYYAGCSVREEEWGEMVMAERTPC